MAKIISTFRFVYKSIIAVSIGVFTLFAASYILDVYDAFAAMFEPRVVEKLVHVEVEKPQADLKTLIKEIPPKYGIPPLLAAAMVERESGGKMDAIRYEPGQVDRAKKITKNESQIRMYASSHCALQIMGWHAPRYGLSWSDLYDPETCVEVSMSILKDCMDRHTGKRKVDQIKGALTCYNGSPVYAQAIKDRLSDLLIEHNL